MSPAAYGVRWRPVDRFYQFALLGLLGSSFLALATSSAIDGTTIALAVFGLVTRVLQLTGVVPFVRTHRAQWIGLAICLVLGFSDWLFLTRDLTASSIHSAALVIVWKLLTVARSGDLRFLAFGQLIGAAMLSSYSSFAICLALFLVFAVAAYCCSEVKRCSAGEAGPSRAVLPNFERRMTLLSVSVAGGIILMTGVLFFLLPRTARAALQHLKLTGGASALASDITLGKLGDLKQSSAAFMHIRLHHPDPSKSLKWRGRTLGFFNGRRWSIGEPGGQLTPMTGSLSLLSGAPSYSGGQRISYEVQLQTPGSGTLFFAGIPEAIRIDAERLVRHGDNSYRILHGDGEAARYTGYSMLLDPSADSSDLPIPITAEQRRVYLQLPRVDPRIPQLASQIAGVGAPAAQAAAITQYLRKNYGYTTKLLDHEVPDPLAYFLFERRKGHCEYFASAMAVMLRTIGIPSRIATGFQSGYYNPLSGMQVVRGTDAHAWVEAYIPGRGWATFDPTPGVDRSVTENLFSRMELYLDAADSFWQEWVLHYDLERQFTLAVKLEQTRRSFDGSWWRQISADAAQFRQNVAQTAKSHGPAVTAVVAALALVLFLRRRVVTWLQVRWQRQRVRRGLADAHDATLLYGQMLRTLQRRGMEKPAWLTPTEFAGVLPKEEIRPLVSDFTQLYHQLRFGGDRAAAERMLLLLERLETLR